MIEPPPPRSRRKLFLVLGALLLVVVAGLVVLVIWAMRVLASAPPPQAAPPPADTVPAPLAGHTTCRAVQLFFPQDADMTAASGTFRDDPRVLRVFVETKAESYERFKVLFKDNKELLQLTRPDSLPASVALTVKPGTDLEGFAAELRPRYPKTEQVRVQDLDKEIDKVPPESRPAWGTRCPASGEL